MPTVKFSPNQCAEIMDVFSGNRCRFKDGSIRVSGISRDVKHWLCKTHGLLIKIDGRYYARKAGTYDQRAEYLNPHWSELPVEVLFHAVAAVFDESGKIGHSIVGKKKLWDSLNLIGVTKSPEDQAKREDEIIKILCTLDSYGFIYFQFAGDVWCIETRKDRPHAENNANPHDLSGRHDIPLDNQPRP